MPLNNDPPQNTNTDVMVKMKKTHRFLRNDKENLRTNYMNRLVNDERNASGFVLKKKYKNVIFWRQRRRKFNMTRRLPQNG